MLLLSSFPSLAQNYLSSGMQTDGSTIVSNQNIISATAFSKSTVVTPSTGFSATIPNGITIYIMNNAALLATGTLTMPASPMDGQPLTIESPKGITLFALNANSGQTISGPTITAAAANFPIRYKYAAATSTWYPN